MKDDTQDYGELIDDLIDYSSEEAASIISGIRIPSHLKGTDFVKCSDREKKIYYFDWPGEDKEGKKRYSICYKIILSAVTDETLESFEPTGRKELRIKRSDLKSFIKKKYKRFRPRNLFSEQEINEEETENKDKNEMVTRCNELKHEKENLLNQLTEKKNKLISISKKYDIISKDLNPRKKKSLHRVISALVDTIFELVPRNTIQNQSALITYLASTFDGYEGLAKRTLEQTFRDAKEIFKEL
ncbi:MAG: hypothetical protein AB8G05_13340 [Oligoflexales bacterium]